MMPLLRSLALLATAAASLVSMSCAPNTPRVRIQHNVSLYEALPAEHKELVHQGRIAKGMSKHAVYLALGRPGRKLRGFRDDAPFERWDYTRLRPTYHHSFHGYHGYGSGRHGYHTHGIGFSPSVSYLPYRAASVLFKREEVDSWEQLSPGHPMHRYHP